MLPQSACCDTAAACARGATAPGDAPGQCPVAVSPAGHPPSKTAPASAEGRTARTDTAHFPFGLARFLASLHIVAGHLHARGRIGNAYLFTWGFTWVPWFFLLSGFVLFSAHARRPTRATPLEYVRRRAVTIWPLYAASLLPALALSKAQWHVPTPSAPCLLAQTLLMQAWVPWLTEHALQMHCWFLSCMVVYWLAFPLVAPRIARLSMRATGAALCAAFSVPWVAAVGVPALAHDLYWYQRHRFGGTAHATDIALVLLKFHPLCYAHVFAAGMLLAHLRGLLGLRCQGWWRYPLEGLAAGSYALLAAVFSVAALRPPAFRLSARLSVLLPLQVCHPLRRAGDCRHCPAPPLTSLVNIGRADGRL